VAEFHSGDQHNSRGILGVRASSPNRRNRIARVGTLASLDGPHTGSRKFELT
jgi:hypothetical protein